MSVRDRSLDPISKRHASEPGGRVPAYLCIPKTLLREEGTKAPAVLCLRHAMLVQPLRNISKVLRRDSEVEQAIALRTKLLIDTLQKRLQLLKALIIVELGLEVPHILLHQQVVILKIRKH